MKQIFIYVQHLLGTGHLKRVEAIADCLAGKGLAVSVASGGIDVPHFHNPEVSTIQLPGIRSDASFNALYDSEGNPVTNSLWKHRMELLGQAYSAIKPDMLIVESYPFARRQMRREINALLEIARLPRSRRTLVACSVRDIVQPKTDPKRIDETISLVKKYFDYVLVHGDKEFIPFERTFPRCSEFQDKIIYTGYISRLPLCSSEPSRNSNSIVVSAGGGAAGKSLYKHALQAASSKPGENYTWLILVGNSLDNAYFAEMKAWEKKHIRIERNRTDFRDLLSGCACSVSQGGYNTIMDLLATHTPAVIIPFEGEGEIEQLTRTRELAKRGRVQFLRESRLEGSSLLRSIRVCCETDPAKLGPILNLGGTETLYKFANKVLSYC